MTGILVDTDVLLDVVTEDAVWADWSQRQLESWGIRANLLINAVIYAEASIGFGRIEEIDEVMATARIELADIPRPALFLAGKVFRNYRRQGGRKTGVLPDFFIGAHAAVAGLPLVSRDTRRYRIYFPTLNLISPDRGPRSAITPKQAGGGRR